MTPTVSCFTKRAYAQQTRCCPVERAAKMSAMCQLAGPIVIVRILFRASSAAALLSLAPTTSMKVLDPCDRQVTSTATPDPLRSPAPPMCGSEVKVTARPYDARPGHCQGTSRGAGFAFAIVLNSLDRDTLTTAESVQSRRRLLRQLQ